MFCGGLFTLYHQQFVLDRSDTARSVLTMLCLQQENEEKKERKERSPGGGVGRFVGWFRGRSARGGSSANGGAGTSYPSAGSRPGSSPGLGPASSLSLSIGGSTSSGVNGSSHGEPATEAERRMAAREISADNLSLPRAASLQLPAPVNCQVRDCGYLSFTGQVNGTSICYV